MTNCDAEVKVESDDDSDFGRNGELLVADGDEPTDQELLSAFFDNRTIEFARSLVQKQVSDARNYLAAAPLGKRCDLKDLDTLALGCFDVPTFTSSAKSVFSSPSLKSEHNYTSQSQSSELKTHVGLRRSQRIKTQKAQEAEADTTPKSPILTKRKRIRVESASTNRYNLSGEVLNSCSATDVDIERDLKNTVYYYFKHVVAEADATRYRKRLTSLRRAIPYPFCTVTNEQ